MLKASDRVYWLTSLPFVPIKNILVPLLLNAIPFGSFSSGSRVSKPSVVVLTDLIRLAPPDKSKLLFNENW